ncbi:hypothetical protein G7075_08390 [Phycicoccus sp. HDW14]|uniref:RNA polymerase sigma factor n=1 Tax=Phycicoccus sp. HDW14 TaxID=2714941 RepID=UPI00140C2506|nr:hypothetical protein [Phycicoccus sp. HDW14]QIM21142.1 hypothetical protein G7075_08390 [Phycicoccus sp. HDW14]
MVSDERAAARPEADFVDFAGVHEGPALRVAALVCGDAATAERVVLEALAAIASDWGTAREEGPAAALRAELHRRALDAAPPEVPGPDGLGPPTAADVEPRGDLLTERRVATLAVLTRLTARQRSLAALRWLEERPDAETARLSGLDAAGLRDGLDTIRAGLGPVLGVEEGDPPPTDDEVRDLLELVTDEEPGQTPLADRAWALARERRRTLRRRVLLGGVAVLAGGAATVSVLGREDPPARRPAPSPSPSPGDERLDGVVVAGATVHLAPTPEAEARLPLYPDARQLALPERLGPGNGPLELLSPAGTTASVRAVYLVRVTDEGYQPALFLPRQSPNPVLVAMAPLRGTVDASGNASFPIGPRTIDSDRHRLVFAQPGAVVLLEVRSGRTRRFPVPDQTLTTAGWATDARTVVATSEKKSWLVDTRTGEVSETVVPVNAGWADIGVAGGDTVIRGYSGRGSIVDVVSLEGPQIDVHGESISNIEGWACSAAYLGPIEATGNRIEGLAAAQRDTRPYLTVLAASTAEGVMATPYRPLGWGPRDTVLLESRTLSSVGRPVLRLLAWDVIEARLYQVAELDTPAYPAPGASDDLFTGAWAL